MSAVRAPQDGPPEAPPGGGTLDIGLRAVEAIRSALQVDDEWSTGVPRGFAWWANEYRQDVVSSAPWQEHGDQLAAITVRTELLSLAPEAGPSEDELSQLNRQALGGAYRIDGGRIVHEFGVVVDEERLGWVKFACATYATLALTLATSSAEQFGARFDAKPAVSQHPQSGPRFLADDILNLPARLVVPAGLEPSAWADPAPLAEAVGLLNALGGFAVDTSGTHGVWGEVPYGDHQTAFLVVAPTRPTPGVPGGMPLEPHPVLGHGLVIWLVLPTLVHGESAAATAARLNEQEITSHEAASSGRMHFGAWTVTDFGAAVTPAYHMFVPNMLRDYVHPQNVTVHMIGRARRVSKTLLPTEATKTALQIVADRALAVGVVAGALAAAFADGPVEKSEAVATIRQALETVRQATLSAPVREAAALATTEFGALAQYVVSPAAVPMPELYALAGDMARTMAAEDQYRFVGQLAWLCQEISAGLCRSPDRARHAMDVALERMGFTPPEISSAVQFCEAHGA